MEKERVKGIGFDATCSLVALDESGNALSVSLTGKYTIRIVVLSCASQVDRKIHT